MKKDRKKAKEEADQISLEELIDQERQALGPNVHKVTFETFMAWKKRKVLTIFRRVLAQRDRRLQRRRRRWPKKMPRKRKAWLLVVPVGYVYVTWDH